MEDVSVEPLSIGQSWNLRITAGAYGDNDTVKLTMGNIIDDPFPAIVFIHSVDSGIEFCPLIQTILLPQFSELADDLLTVQVSGSPVDRWAELVGGRVSSYARGICYLLTMPLAARARGAGRGFNVRSRSLPVHHAHRPRKLP